MARILVTGARRGIGREITLTLARAGHEVVATMRDTSGSDLADIAAQEGLAISLAALDVDDDASVAALFAQAGMASVDVLINNAGILSINALEDESMDMIQAVMNTNFFGPVRCMKAVVPAMRERRQGLIINLSSIAGRMAVFSHSAYGPSRCLVPGFDGAIFDQGWKDALWARFYTGAPARQRQSVEQYKIVKRA
jgi:NAD(P)-dependent dehydrogenase (short-subunit alcohol dehydrogenase family)